MAKPLRKLALAVLGIGVSTSLLTAVTFSAFSATTANAGNTFSTGTVVLGDNDADGPLYHLSNVGPGATEERCIRVTYTGSMASDVHLYTNTTNGGSLGAELRVTIAKGTLDGATPFPDCDGFASEAEIFDGTLASFMGAKHNYATGIPAYPGSQTQWNQNDVLAYRFTVTLPQGSQESGAVAVNDFVWEARNQ